MGWLSDVTDWMGDQIQRVWDAFTEFMGDFLLAGVEMLLDFSAFVIEKIPAPEFIAEYTIGGMLGNIGSDLLWIVGNFRFAEGLAAIGAGYGFRLLRKALTLGQW